MFYSTKCDSFLLEKLERHWSGVRSLSEPLDASMVSWCGARASEVRPCRRFFGFINMTKNMTQIGISQSCNMSQLCSNILLCLIVSILIMSASSRPPFSFQLHSFNDLREFIFRSTTVCHLMRCCQVNGRSCCPKPLPLSVLPCSSK